MWALLNHLDFLSAVAGLMARLVACGVGIAGAFLLVLISTSVLDYLV